MARKTLTSATGFLHTDAPGISIQPVGTGSMSMWVYRDSTQAAAQYGYPALFTRPDNVDIPSFRVHAGTGDSFRGLVRNTAGSYYNIGVHRAFPLDTWANLIYVKLTGGFRGYLDGVEFWSGSFAGSATQDPMRINVGPNSGLWVAELAVWQTHQLTAAEIADLVAGVNPTEVAAASLISYWPIFGDADPEPPVVGGVDLLLVNAPPKADTHPPVNPAVPPPVASFTVDVTGVTVDVDASASTAPDSSITGYEWDWGDGSPVGSGIVASHEYANSGEYVITLTITNTTGATDTTQETITANRGPTAVITGGVSGSLLEVSGLGSTDPDSDPLTYAWKFGDGSGNAGATVSHTYALPGTYIVTLTVTDSFGATDVDTIEVYVSPPPVALFDFEVDYMKATFDASDSYSPEDLIADYSWDFGDGNIGSGVTVEHTYETSQRVIVTLTVTDEFGRIDTAQVALFPKSYYAVGASIEIRPDAVSLDHRTAFSYGPVAYQDLSAGLIVTAWRIRINVNNLILEQDVGGVWVQDRVLYTFEDGTVVTELSLAFNQNAEAAFAAEIGGEVYIYRFDAVAGQWVFESLGTGRTPRLVLDLPYIIAESDLQLFYVSDILASVAYRTQRENFAIERVLPFDNIENIFLEKVLPSKGYRLTIIYSLRSIVPGTYSIHELYSKLLPIASHELLGINAEPVSGELADVAIAGESNELTTISAAVEAGLIEQPVIEEESEAELLTITAVPTVSTLINPFVDGESESEPVLIQAGPVVGSLLDVVIDRESETEQLTISAEVTNVYLGP